MTSMAGSEEQQRVIACDFDSTLAQYDKFEGADILGAPIPEMVERVKAALAAGVEVWIFTARTNPGDNSAQQCVDSVRALVAISQWCQQVFGSILPITHEKSRRFTELWDDRAKEVIPNTGIFVTELFEALNGDSSQDVSRQDASQAGASQLRQANRAQPATR